MVSDKRDVEITILKWVGSVRQKGRIDALGRLFKRS